MTYLERSIIVKLCKSRHNIQFKAYRASTNIASCPKTIKLTAPIDKGAIDDGTVFKTFLGVIKTLEYKKAIRSSFSYTLVQARL